MRMRWYDRDQTVSLAMSIIKNSNEKAQLRVAKLIVRKLNEFGVTKNYTIFQRFEGFIKRWYDENDELFESFEALKAAPRKIQKEIALEIINFLHELEAQEAKKAKEAMSIEEISTINQTQEIQVFENNIETITVKKSNLTLLNEEDDTEDNPGGNVEKDAETTT